MTVSVLNLSRWLAFMMLMGPGQPSSAPTDTRPAGTALVLRNVTVVNGEPPQRQEHCTILIRDDRIADVVAGEAPSIPEGAKVLDLTGRYVIPGLIEGHVHLRGLPDRQLEYALRWGITSIRSMGDDAAYVREVKAAIEDGELLGPRIFYSAAFAGPRFFEEDRRARLVTPDEYKLGDAPWMRRVDEQTDVRAIVREAKECGATGIKLYNFLAPELVRTIVLEAHRQHLKVWSHPHLTYADGQQLAAAKVDLITHCMGLLLPVDWDQKRDGGLALQLNDLASGRLNAALAVAAQNHVVLEPTWVVFTKMLGPHAGDPETAQKQAAALEVLKRARARGITLVAGTDLDLPQRREEKPRLFDELACFVELVGMTPTEALATATHHSAAVLGRDELGSITKGKLADLVVLEKDPTQDIRNVAEVELVIKNGQLVR
jgi:imidazolonepropionase-like amidohydrolase